MLNHEWSNIVQDNGRRRTRQKVTGEDAGSTSDFQNFLRKRVWNQGRQTLRHGTLELCVPVVGFNVFGKTFDDSLFEIRFGGIW